MLRRVEQAIAGAVAGVAGRSARNPAMSIGLSLVFAMACMSGCCRSCLCWRASRCLLSPLGPCTSFQRVLATASCVLFAKPRLALSLVRLCTDAHRVQGRRSLGRSRFHTDARPGMGHEHLRRRTKAHRDTLHRKKWRTRHKRCHEECCPRNVGGQSAQSATHLHSLLGP